MKLNQEVYSKSAICAAIKDFSRIATIECAEVSGYWDLVFSNCRLDDSLVQAELENYLIDVMNV